MRVLVCIKRVPTPRGPYHLHEVVPAITAELARRRG